MHRWGRLARDRKNWVSERGIRELTCPAEDLVTPECSRIEQMLHQCIVSPEPHPINHPPLSFFIQLICSALREISGVLEEISGIIC